MRNPNCSGKHAFATPWQLERTEQMFTRMLRNDAKVEQKARCTYCRDQMVVVTAEHLQPRSKGGSTTRKNIKAACKLCNQAKSNGSEAWFRRVLHQRDIPLGDTAIAKAWVRYRLNICIERSEKRLCKFAGVAA